MKVKATKQFLKEMNEIKVSRELLKQMVDYIENCEWNVECRYKEGYFDIKDLIKDGGMPSLYYDLKKLLEVKK